MGGKISSKRHEGGTPPHAQRAAAGWRWRLAQPSAPAANRPQPSAATGRLVLTQHARGFAQARLRPLRPHHASTAGHLSPPPLGLWPHRAAPPARLVPCVRAGGEESREAVVCGESHRHIPLQRHRCLPTPGSAERRYRRKTPCAARCHVWSRGAPPTGLRVLARAPSLRENPWSNLHPAQGQRAAGECGLARTASARSEPRSGGEGCVHGPGA